MWGGPGSVFSSPVVARDVDVVTCLSTGGAFPYTTRLRGQFRQFWYLIFVPYGVYACEALHFPDSEEKALWIPNAQWTLATPAHWEVRYTFVGRRESSTPTASQYLVTSVPRGTLAPPYPVELMPVVDSDGLRLPTYDGLLAHCPTVEPSAGSVFSGSAGYIATNSLSDIQIIDKICDAVAGTRISDYLVGGYQELVDWGDLTVDLLKSHRHVDVSIPLMFLDVGEITNYVNAIRLNGFTSAGLGKTLKWVLSADRKSFGQWLRGFSGLYLWKKYAVDTLSSDLNAIGTGLRKFADEASTRERLHSRRSYSYLGPSGDLVNVTQTLTAEIGKYPTWFLGQVQGLIGWMKQWGMYPKLTDLYDIIPLSFVLDWLVDFGGAIKNVTDYKDIEDYFPVDYCIMSAKASAVIDARHILSGIEGVSGTICVVAYHRWISKHIPLPDTSLGWGPGLTDRWAQAGALVFQRTRVF